MRYPKRIDIGVNYLTRWFLIKRNRNANAYLHRFRGNDDDRALHCHPWPSVSIRLWGQLREFYFEEDPYFDLGITVRRIRSRLVPRICYRPAEFAHRLELVDNKPCWTLFLTGKRCREWYFHCPGGKVLWSLMTNRQGDKLGDCDDHK